MKILFAGTPDFAATALVALLDKGYPLSAVLTQPDRPAGRGMQCLASPVKQVAIQNGLKVLQPASLKSPEIQQELALLQPDLMIVAAYGLILPKAVLEIPKHGCLNIHASLLPRWRGAAPIQRAILAGDTATGITIMQMDEGLDTGDMLLKRTCPIAETDTASTLHDKLTLLGAEAILEALRNLQRDERVAEAQNNDLATYASKLTKSEARLDWGNTAQQLDRAIRGYNPFPVGYGEIKNTLVKIWQARVLPDVQGEPGKIVRADKEQLVVACGVGGLSLERLQRPGGKALPVAQFLQGFEINVGDCFAKDLA